MPPDPFAELYARTFRRVWSALGRRGIRTRADQEDFAQDVYLIAHEKLHTRNPAVSELAWLLTIAGNLVKNHRALQRTQKEKPMDDPDAVLDVAADARGVDEIVLHQAQYLALVQGLSAERRDVFEMFEVEGFTVPEIAAELKLPEGTVSTRLRLAREHVSAAAARMKARAERATPGGAARAMFFPFGAGAWQHVRGLFDDAPEGAEAAVWRGVTRGLARAAVMTAMGAGATGFAVGGTAAGATGAAAGKLSAGVLVGSGVTLGGVIVVGVMVLLRVLAPAAATPPPVAVPDAPRLAGVAGGTTTEAPERGQELAAPASTTNAGPASSGVSAARAAVPSPSGPVATATAPVSQIDPEELAHIARAQVAFARKDRAGTIEALDAHMRKFPHGKLASDREGIRAKLAEVAGSWGGGGTNNPGGQDAGRGRVFGSED